jgi:gliding motility-associated protein GldL
MAKLYGIGASLVISGALFKILHWPGADWMLVVGMLTEAVIFFFSAFEPLHKEYDWALVYPELQDQTQTSNLSKFPGSVTQQLDNMLQEAKIGPDLIESLASGMRNLSDNAQKLSVTTDAAMVTEGYVTNLSKAKDAVQNLTGVYEKSADELSATSDMQVKSIQEMFEVQKQHAQNMQDMQTQNVQKIGQIQEHGTQAIMDNYKKIEESTVKLATSMNDTLQEAQKYKEEIDKLSKNVAQINSIYANMLAAMTAK